MQLSEIIIDPEFQSLIPSLSAGEREGLESSLKADGCVSPLIVWQDHNILLDGHNRYDICRRQNIACKFHQVVLASREAAKAWIIRHQLGRRNLKESQRAMLATTLEEIYASQARTRQVSCLKKGAIPVPANLPEREKGEAREQAAADMNVSPRLVQAAKKVRESGTENLQSAVRAGEVSVSAAAEVARLPREKQDQAVAGGAKGIVAAARKVRSSRRGMSGISPHAMKPFRKSEPLPPKTALELPHDPLWAARALISTFDREFLVGLVQTLTKHLQGDNV